MGEQACLHVRQWLQEAPLASGNLPGADLVAHVAACSACRGLLLAATGELFGVSAPPAPLRCSECEQRLDAYIDWEETHGPAAAARRYPQIWWHLLQCPACAAIYAGVHALLHAEATGAFVLPPLPRPASTLQLPRAYLHAALAPQIALGVRWGADDAEQIGATQVGPYQLTLAAYAGDAATVTMLVQVDPPAPGVVELRLDPLVRRAPLATDGTARIADLPVALFTAAGADLCLDLELDEPFT